MTNTLKKSDTVYYARIFPKIGMYELNELKIRTIGDTYFVGIDTRSKQAMLFGFNTINDTVFFNRKEALNKVKEAEKNKDKQISEIYYEEY